MGGRHDMAEVTLTPLEIPKWKEIWRSLANVEPLTPLATGRLGVFSGCGHPEIGNPCWKTQVTA